jgi:hypothetical protein
MGGTWCFVPIAWATARCGLGFHGVHRTHECNVWPEDGLPPFIWTLGRASALAVLLDNSSRRGGWAFAACVARSRSLGRHSYGGIKSSTHTAGTHRWLVSTHVDVLFWEIVKADPCAKIVSPEGRRKRTWTRGGVVLSFER